MYPRIVCAFAIVVMAVAFAWPSAVWAQVNHSVCLDESGYAARGLTYEQSLACASAFANAAETALARDDKESAQRAKSRAQDTGTHLNTDNLTDEKRSRFWNEVRRAEDAYDTLAAAQREQREAELNARAAEREAESARQRRRAETMQLEADLGRVESTPPGSLDSLADSEFRAIERIVALSGRNARRAKAVLVEAEINTNTNDNLYVVAWEYARDTEAYAETALSVAREVQFLIEDIRAHVANNANSEAREVLVKIITMRAELQQAVPQVPTIW